MKSLENKKRELLIFSIVGGISAIVVALADILIRQLARNSPLCPENVISGGSCAYIGVLLPQVLTMVLLALILFFLFKKYFKYSFYISFFTLGYSFHLSNIIGWLYSPLEIVSATWVFYVLLLLLGSLLGWLFHGYFTILKMWLWLKLILAFMLLLVLPYILLYFERQLYATFYLG